MVSTSELHEKTKTLSLLFVEDDSNLAKQMKQLFENFFKEVTIAYNGREGLDIFKSKLEQEEREPFDLVISDINMPVMDGITMVKEIYKVIPEQVVIITSAYNDSDYLLDLLNIGVDGFLMKPINIESIKRSLYTTAKAIHNERLVKKNNIAIEKLNKELQKSNDELNLKNIALEQSMRIIEGIHNKNSVTGEKDTGIEFEKKQDRVEQEQDNTPLESQDLTLREESLKNIQFIVCNLSMKYSLDGIAHDLLQSLSKSIINYTNYISEEKVYQNLKSSLKQLAAVVLHRPVIGDEEELHTIFAALESFFFIYSKWQGEWLSVDHNRFEPSSRAIEDEIGMIISLWESKV